MSETVQTVDVQQVRKQISADNGARVIDIRDGDHYSAGHIPGALHIPLLRLKYKPDFVPDDKPVILYSDNAPEDHKSCEEAARILIERGLEAQVMKGGMPAWIEAGYDVEFD